MLGAPGLGATTAGSAVAIAAHLGRRPISEDGLPPRPANAPPEPDYSQPGVLEDIATRAGLEPEQTFDVSWAYEYPNDATARRALVAPAGLALLVGRDREEQLKDAIVAGLAEHRTADGSYQLRNAFHGLIARAR